MALAEWVDVLQFEVLDEPGRVKVRDKYFDRRVKIWKRLDALLQGPMRSSKWAEFVRLTAVVGDRTTRTASIDNIDYDH